MIRQLDLHNLYHVNLAVIDFLLSESDQAMTATTSSLLADIATWY